MRESLTQASLSPSSKLAAPQALGGNAPHYLQPPAIPRRRWPTSGVCALCCSNWRRFPYGHTVVKAPDNTPDSLPGKRLGQS